MKKRCVSKHKKNERTKSPYTPLYKSGLQAFFVFNLLDFKLMLFDSILNSGTGTPTYLFQILRCGNGNSSQTQRSWLKCPFVTYSRKTRKGWDQSLVTLS